MKARKEKAALTHIDADDRPTMVAVGHKKRTRRSAWARGTMQLPPEVLQFFDGKEIRSKKGPVFQTAIIAGTMAVKKTYDLIPFCHPIAIDACTIDVRLDANTVVIDCVVECEEKTGVEMEALTGANIAALTIYDMCKAVSQDIRITSCQLMAKAGGKSNFLRQTTHAPKKT